TSQLSRASLLDGGSLKERPASRRAKTNRPNLLSRIFDSAVFPEPGKPHTMISLDRGRSIKRVSVEKVGRLFALYALRERAMPFKTKSARYAPRTVDVFEFWSACLNW